MMLFPDKYNAMVQKPSIETNQPKKCMLSLYPNWGFTHVEIQVPGGSSSNRGCDLNFNLLLPPSLWTPHIKRPWGKETSQLPGRENGDAPSGKARAEVTLKGQGQQSLHIRWPTLVSFSTLLSTLDIKWPVSAIIYRPEVWGHSFPIWSFPNSKIPARVWPVQTYLISLTKL